MGDDEVAWDEVAWWVDVVIDGHRHTIRLVARSVTDAGRLPGRALHQGEEVLYETIHRGRLRVKWGRVAAVQVGRITLGRPR